MRVVFDLDGTLADLTHRLPLIQQPKPNWPLFFRECPNDLPIVKMIELNRTIAMINTVEVWSGRSEIVRPHTRKWLKDYGVIYHRLRMRAENDYRSDDVVKGEWLENTPRDEWPDLVFDDRLRVVKMWRDHGIICCQVAPGDF